ncbi:MAE_28990/MAE_18760 family HEPN-like nuclease, partial [Acetobacter sp.]|uniref:MAE_28990/MAE_18760 family HEPN-like nuclease n=1 Tax=Acetobacter sp. TaxID=440 RepID=UPI0039EB7AB4
IDDISISIVNMSFDERKILNGNVDARTIKTLSEIYGFSTETNKETTHNGTTLYIIKSQRQNLSHGDMSFSDVGKDYTPKEIARIYKCSSAYMEGILKNIVHYAESKNFLNDPS